MATETVIQSSMTSEAYDLSDNFVEELRRMVYSLAEDFARKRGSVRHGGGAVVDVEDMQAAANSVARVWKKMAESGELSEKSAREIDEMIECLRSPVS